MNAKEILVKLSIKKEFDWDKTYEAISNKEAVGETYDIEDINEYLTLVDEEYPKMLKHSYKPPFAFKYTGDITKGAECKCVLLLGDNIFGFDEEEIVRIVENKVVFGKDRLIINTMSKKPNSAFKIASCLCRSVAITRNVNFDDNIIASLALNNGKDIYVVPTGGENNQLIKNGAYLLDCKEDIVVPELQEE